MAPERSRFLRQITFVLVAISALATELASVENGSAIPCLAQAVVWIAVAAAIARFVPAPVDGRRVPPRKVLFCLLAVAAAPFVVEPVRRGLLGNGYPLELQMVFALRNLGLVLAACSVWLLCLRLACVTSLFLILFAISMTDHSAMLALLGLYSATGTVWLMSLYWTGLERYFVGSESAVVLSVQPGTERLPWLAVFLVVALVGCVLGLVAVGPQRAAQVLAEWLPTSGGTGANDPFARGGVNDGDEEVKGPNARSTGMTESDALLDSPLPSLYDMISDMYGEPFKPKEHELAIALDAKPQAKQTDKPAENLRPNREFTSARRGPRQPRDSSDRAARALFEVEGRTPLHVRATAFDSFDGVSWQEAPLNSHACLLIKEAGSCWMAARESRLVRLFAETTGHKFRLTHSSGSLVPTPPHLVRFRLGRVDRANFFAWGPEQILRLAERKTPSGVTVETESRLVDVRKLASVPFAAAAAQSRNRLTAVPPTLHSEVKALARQWGADKSRGWEQIDSVVQRLRTEYVHDPAAHTPPGCSDPLAHFLLQARRGPDYQFANSAAVLLRVLGYSTRLVSGFYVSPEHYDSETRMTPVVQEDLHFWAEVLLPSGDWLVLEPTPGYELLGPNPHWTDRLLAGLLTMGSWLWDHAAASMGIIVSLAGLWWKRHELVDALAVMLLWRLPADSWQIHVGRVLWLLERRGRWTGRARPASQTPTTWLRLNLPSQIHQRDALQQLTLMADWSAYGSDLTPPWRVSDVQCVCRRIVDECSLKHWKTAVTDCRGADA